MHSIIKSNLLQLNCILVFEGAFGVGFMRWGFSFWLVLLVFGWGFSVVFVVVCVGFVFFSLLNEDTFPFLQQMCFPSVLAVFLLRSVKTGGFRKGLVELGRFFSTLWKTAFVECHQAHLPRYLLP